MPFQPGANINTVAFGNRPENVEVPHLDVRAPTTNDYNYPIGKRWINQGIAEYVLLSISTAGGVAAANWSSLGTDTGPLNTLSDDSSVTVAPVAGNIQIAGTSGEIATTAGVGAITLSIPAVFTAPGSIASTTTLTAGTSLAVTTSATVGTTLGVTGATTLAALTQVGTANINTSGAAITTIGTGGTGATRIGNATGNTAVTGSLTASTGLVATTGGITATGTSNINTTGAAVTSINTGGTGALNLGNATGNTAVTGSLSTTTSLAATTTVTGGTGVTATTGDVTSTAGSLVSTVGSLKLNGVASRVLINAAAPTTAPVGLVTLSGAATTTLTSSAITANSIILFSLKTLGTVVDSAITYTVTGGSATITPFSSTDTSIYGYLVIN